MSSKYDVSSVTIESLFLTVSSHFEIPSFQRNYAWGAAEVEQMLDDIFIATEPKDLPYFLGSIVLATKDPNDRKSPLLVLDGQQRLTTLSLLIAILIQKLKEHGYDDHAQFKNYLESSGIKNLTRENRPLKLHLQNEDIEPYQKIISNPNCWPEYKATALGHATGRAIKTIELIASSDFSLKGSDELHTYLNMFARLLEEVEIVQITTSSERDAFKLFETLNDRGLALSAADLIKNKLLSRCEDEINDASDSWMKIVEATKDDDIVNFLRAYWIAHYKLVRKNDLYDEYREYISKLTKTKAAGFAIDLAKAAQIYKKIINPFTENIFEIDPTTQETLRRITFSYKSKSCRAALLACAIFQPRHFKKIVAICESISVRYSVVGEKNPNRLENIYEQICILLRKPEFDISTISRLPDLTEIPDDSEFQFKLASAQTPTQINAAWREILVQYNDSLSTGETKIAATDKVHVEHILPLTFTAAVLDEAEITEIEANDLKQRIGNLTLLSKKINQSISNKPFSIKRTELEKSEIGMTKAITAATKWGKNEIEERSELIAKKLVDIFPHPKNII